MTKVHLKLAEIRKNNDSPCPFGLPIPFGCRYAGKNVERMAPLDIMGEEASDEEKEQIGSANTKLLAWNLLRSTEEPSVCPYAGHILQEKEAVECNYNDTAPGQGPAQSLNTSPFYAKVFTDSINGLYTYPVGFYSDYNVSRNLYFGTYSLQGAAIAEFIKMAADEIVKGPKYTNTSE